jgi:hypothetical protein
MSRRSDRSSTVPQDHISRRIVEYMSVKFSQHGAPADRSHGAEHLDADLPNAEEPKQSHDLAALASGRPKAALSLFNSGSARA